MKKFVLLFACIAAIMAASANELTLTPKDTLVPPSGITSGVGSLEHFRAPGTVIIGDFIYITVTDMDALLDFQEKIPLASAKDTSRQIILYADDIPLYDIRLITANRVTNRCTFHLKKDSRFLEVLYPGIKFMWSSLPVKFRIGFKNGVVIDPDLTLTTNMKYVSAWGFWCAVIFVVFLVAGFTLLAWFTNLINTGTKDTPYSLGLAQLMFWTIIILGSWVYILAVDQVLAPLSSSTLALLGISLATTGFSKGIDVMRKVDRNQIKTTTGRWRFFRDILTEPDLSGEKGSFSLPRCQMFLWTLILGVVFIVAVVRDQQMPDLDSSLLILMGISSTGYVGLKGYEEVPKKEASK